MAKDKDEAPEDAQGSQPVENDGIPTETIEANQQAKATAPPVSPPASPPAPEFADPHDEDDELAADQTDAPPAKAGHSDETQAPDDDITAEAKSYGLDPADFPNASAMQKAIIALDRQIARLGSAGSNLDSRQAGAHNSVNQDAVTSSGATPGGQQPQPPDRSADAFQTGQADEDLELPEGEFDPDVERVIKAMKNKVKSLEEQMMRQQAVAAQEYSRRIDEQIDGFFDELGDEFSAMFGKGRMADIKPDSEQAKNRVRVAKMAEDLMRGDVAAGRQMRDLKKALNSGLRGEFTDEVEKITRRQLSKQVEKRRKQAIARPTHRQQRPLSPVERAAQFAENFIREKVGEGGFAGADDDLGGEI